MEQSKRRSAAMPESWRSLLSRKSDRFWSKVDRSVLDGCWIWTASRQSGEYGQIGRTIEGRCIMILAHRMAYFLVKGEIPAAHDVRHTCGERLCCNPAHLFLKKVEANPRTPLAVAV
jgi:hypothetical protein